MGKPELKNRIQEIDSMFFNRRRLEESFKVSMAERLDRIQEALALLALELKDALRAVDMIQMVDGEMKKLPMFEIISLEVFLDTSGDMPRFYTNEDGDIMYLQELSKTNSKRREDLLQLIHQRLQLASISFTPA